MKLIIILISTFGFQNNIDCQNSSLITEFRVLLATKEYQSKFEKKYNQERVLELGNKYDSLKDLTEKELDFLINFSWDLKNYNQYTQLMEVLLEKKGFDINTVEVEKVKDLPFNPSWLINLSGGYSKIKSYKKAYKSLMLFERFRRYRNGWCGTSFYSEQMKIDRYIVDILNGAEQYEEVYKIILPPIFRPRETVDMKSIEKALSMLLGRFPSSELKEHFETSKQNIKFEHLYNFDARFSIKIIFLNQEYPIELTRNGMDLYIEAYYNKIEKNQAFEEISKEINRYPIFQILDRM